MAPEARGTPSSVMACELRDQVVLSTASSASSVDHAHRPLDLEQLIAHVAGGLSGQPGECYWFLDEITAVDGPWPAVVKRMRDSNLQFAEDTVVLSGSSATQLEEATKALAGRRGRATSTDRLLLQMPFVEVARALGYDLPSLDRVKPSQLGGGGLAELVNICRPGVSGLVDAWDRYLHVGGYPQAVADHIQQGAVDDSFGDMLFQVVHGDALARASLSPAQTTMMMRARRMGVDMDNQQILVQISELVDEEHRLRDQLQRGEISSDEEHARLSSLERALDQCWDLLRQRTARKDAGQDPETARTRPVDDGGDYLQ